MDAARDDDLPTKERRRAADEGGGVQASYRRGGARSTRATGGGAWFRGAGVVLRRLLWFNGAERLGLVAFFRIIQLMHEGWVFFLAQ
jgi:hypothetical protein